MNLTKISISLGLINLIGLVFLSYFQFQPPSIVYVDSNQLINNYKGKVDARKVYRQKAVSWKRTQIHSPVRFSRASCNRKKLISIIGKKSYSETLTTLNKPIGN